VRLHDNSKFPWIILIPKRKGVTDITNLNSKDQLLLIKEIVYCSKLMKKIFKTSKLNVEKIGNIVPQLHIHIIARNKKDSSWPLSVWVVKGKTYPAKVLKEVINKIRVAFK
jgi:diadenosine tetraphosphate (Ap4A) HIT family hydrolase